MPVCPPQDQRRAVQCDGNLCCVCRIGAGGCMPRGAGSSRTQCLQPRGSLWGTVCEQCCNGGTVSACPALAAPCCWDWGAPLPIHGILRQWWLWRDHQSGWWGTGTAGCAASCPNTAEDATEFSTQQRPSFLHSPLAGPAAVPVSKAVFGSFWVSQCLTYVVSPASSWVR